MRNQDPVGNVREAIRGGWGWTVQDLFDLYSELKRDVDTVKKNARDAGHDEDLFDIRGDDISKWLK